MLNAAKQAAGRETSPASARKRARSMNNDKTPSKHGKREGKASHRFSPSPPLHQQDESASAAKPKSIVSRPANRTPAGAKKTKNVPSASTSASSSIESPKKLGRPPKIHLQIQGNSITVKKSRAGKPAAVTRKIGRKIGNISVPRDLILNRKFQKMNKKARQSWLRRMQEVEVKKQLETAAAAEAKSKDSSDEVEESGAVEPKPKKQPKETTRAPESRRRRSAANQPAPVTSPRRSEPREASKIAAAKILDELCSSGEEMIVDIIASNTPKRQPRSAKSAARKRFAEELCSSEDETTYTIASPAVRTKREPRVVRTAAREQSPEGDNDEEMKEVPVAVTSTPRSAKRIVGGAAALAAVMASSEDDDTDEDDDEYVGHQSRKMQPTKESRRSGRFVKRLSESQKADDAHQSDSLSQHRSPPRRSGSRVRSESEKNRKRPLKREVTDNTVKTAKAPPAKKARLATTTSTARVAISALPRSLRSKIVAAKNRLNVSMSLNVTSQQPSSRLPKRDKRLRPTRILQQIKKMVRTATSESLDHADKVVKKPQKVRLPESDDEDEDLTDFQVAQRVVDKVFPSADRKIGDHWDGSVAHLKRIEEETKKEGTMNDFRTAFWDKYESTMRAEFKKRAMKVPESAYVSLFWKVQQSRNTPSSFTHPSKSCAKLWTKKKKGDHWTVEEVKSVLRFISIGALCELCINPFKLTKCQIREKECECTCPRPIEPMWKSTKVTKGTSLADGQTKDEKRKELWDAQFNHMLKHVEKGLKKRLIDEYGQDGFKKNFPLHATPLSKRKDQFGRDAFIKAKELNAVRREANQCPSFVFAWTSGTEGNLGMPQQWIEDQKSQLSKGSISHLEIMRKHERRAGVSSCKGDCQGVGHRCCDKSFRCNMTFNKDNLLHSTEGLFPAGIDGQGTPRMAWEQDSSLLACDSLCGCKKNCPKRTTERGPQKMQILFKSPDRGWSVRCAETIVRGEYIFSFAGLVMTQEEITNGPSQDTNMFFDLTPKGGWVKAAGMSQLTITTCVKANEFKYVNHSCCPNSMICRIYKRNDGEHVHAIGLFARQKIGAFEEIIYDYYKADATFPFSCKCAGYACRG